MEGASDNLKCAKYIGDIAQIDDNGIITNKKAIKKFTHALDVHAASDELQILVEQYTPELNLPNPNFLGGVVCATDIEWDFYVQEFKKWIFQHVEPTVPRPRRTRPTVAVEAAGVPADFERMMEEDLEFELPPWPETMPADTHQLAEAPPVPQLEAMETELEFDEGGVTPELYFAPPEEVPPPHQDFQDEEPIQVPSVVVPEVEALPEDPTRVHDDQVPLQAAEQRAAIIAIPAIGTIRRRGSPRSRREVPERLEDASAFHEDYHENEELANLEIDDPWFDNIFPAFRVVRLGEHFGETGDQVIGGSSSDGASPSMQRPADSVQLTHIHEAQEMATVSTEVVPPALPDVTVAEYTAPHEHVFEEVSGGDILPGVTDEPEDEHERRTNARYDWIKSLSARFIGQELRIEDITPLPQTRENIVETFMCLSKLSHERIIEIFVHPDKYLKSIVFI